MHMIQIIIRFVVGGFFVSAFSAIGDVLKPKSFAGLFGAAPSVALATLGLTIASKGAAYAALESRSMIAGAIGFFGYASTVSWLMMRYHVRALVATLCTFPLWAAIAFGTWEICLR
jgi:Protein of unknown function (DUF3147)